jgi:uncharacterized protein (TIGR00725 family)
MSKVAVLGGRKIASSKVKEFSETLGEALVSRGFLLVTGGVSGVGELASRVAANWLTDQGRNPEDFVISLLPIGVPRFHPYGRVIHRGRDWAERRGELALFGDYFVAVSGGEGTVDEIKRVIALGKPLIPVGKSGGAALSFWRRLIKEEKDFKKKKILDRVGAAGDFSFMADYIGDYLLSLEGENVEP